MARRGYVYCIANDAIPGIVKIGATVRDPEDRLSEARATTWAPSCFRIVAQAAVDDAFAAEHALHALLAARRFEARREFFALTHARRARSSTSSRSPRPLRRSRVPSCKPRWRSTRGSNPSRLCPSRRRTGSARGSRSTTRTCRCARRTRARSWSRYTRHTRPARRRCTPSPSARSCSPRCSTPCSLTSGRTRTARAP